MRRDDVLVRQKHSIKHALNKKGFPMVRSQASTTSIILPRASGRWSVVGFGGGIHIM